jgi:hypothetical protein
MAADGSCALQLVQVREHLAAADVAPAGDRRHTWERLPLAVGEARKHEPGAKRAVAHLGVSE